MTEIKHKNIDITTPTKMSDTATTASAYPLCAIGEGTNQEERVGRKIALHKITGRLHISSNINNDSFNTCIRIVMVQVTLDYNHALTGADVVDMTFGSGTFNNNIFCMYNTDYVGKQIKVLIDQTIAISSSTTDNHGVFEFTVPLRGTIAKFNGSTTGSCVENQIWLLGFSNESTDDIRPTMGGFMRLYYKDA